ncbi:hypothetical protein [Flavobacterium sp. N2038]|uniref:hypothetical protein n=1 Tax=Flavobacterium sp. N2038 TaxID=2986829 RepID=UPI0022250E28|nr:hypothetical protein [Flavobacterium sp. N2038]
MEDTSNSSEKELTNDQKNKITTERLKGNNLIQVVEKINLIQLNKLKKAVETVINRLENEESLDALKLLKDKGVLSELEYNDKVKSLKK